MTRSPVTRQMAVTRRPTAAAFLAERRDFLHVYAGESVSGHGYDVLLRLDGSYAARAPALAPRGEA